VRAAWLMITENSIDVHVEENELRAYRQSRHSQITW